MKKMMCGAFLLVALGLFLAAPSARHEKILATVIRLEEPQPVNGSGSHLTTVGVVEYVSDGVTKTEFLKGFDPVPEGYPIEVFKTSTGVSLTAVSTGSGLLLMGSFLSFAAAGITLMSWLSDRTDRRSEKRAFAPV